MKWRTSKLACVILLAINLAVNAAEPSPLLPIEFTDAYLNDIPVGGSILVGATVIEPGTSIRTNRLIVNVPDSSSRTICLTLTSRDGRYTASGLYSPDGATGLRTLVLQPKHEKELYSYSQDQVAVLVKAAENCTGPGVIVLSARWSGSSPNAKLSIFLNSQGADAEVSRTDQPEKSISCSRIVGKEIVSFDAECDVSFLLNGGVTPLTISRTRFDSVYPPIRLKFTKP